MVLIGGPSPYMAFDRYLRNDAEKLAPGRRTGPPSEKHLLHLATSGLVDDLVRIDEQPDDDRCEVASIRIIDVLGYRIEEVERRELHPWWDLMNELPKRATC